MCLLPAQTAVGGSAENYHIFHNTRKYRFILIVAHYERRSRFVDVALYTVAHTKGKILNKGTFAHPRLLAYTPECREGVQRQIAIFLVDTEEVGAVETHACSECVALEERVRTVGIERYICVLGIALGVKREETCPRFIGEEHRF